MTNATGPWVAVSEREPWSGDVVLARWKDGALRVVEWTPKKFEGTGDLNSLTRSARHVNIYIAHMAPVAMGFHEWPIEWAEIYR
jgi:phosphopantothenate synthetase